MRKVVMMLHVSLDGYVAPPDGSLEWITYTPELEAYAHAMEPEMDAVIFGRNTYEGMKGYWHDVVLAKLAEHTETEANHARWLDSATKVVISRTLTSVDDWHNSLLIKDNIAEEIAKLKQQPGKDMWLIGSPSIAQEFIRLNLIDEYRINVNPIMLGGGTPLFTGLDQPRRLKLLEARTIEGGVVALRYAPEAA
jgi:dihydrofolate reductase